MFVSFFYCTIAFFCEWFFFAYFIFFSIFIDLKMARHIVVAQCVCFQLFFFNALIGSLRCDCLPCVLMCSIEWENSEHTHACCSICQVCFCNENFCARSRACTQPSFWWSELALRPLFSSFLQFLLIRKARTRRKSATEKDSNAKKSNNNRLLLLRCCRCHRHYCGRFHWSCAALCQWRMRILFGIYSISIEIHSFFSFTLFHDLIIIIRVVTFLFFCVSTPYNGTIDNENRYRSIIWLEIKCISIVEKENAFVTDYRKKKL